MITLIQIDDRYIIPDKKTFLIDSESDITELNQKAEECAPGSIAYTADMSVVYQLGNDHKWYAIAI